MPATEAPSRTASPEPQPPRPVRPRLAWAAALVGALLLNGAGCSRDEAPPPAGAAAPAIASSAASAPGADVASAPEQASAATAHESSARANPAVSDTDPGTAEAQPRSRPGAGGVAQALPHGQGDVRTGPRTSSKVAAREAMRAADGQDADAAKPLARKTVLADQQAWCDAIRPRLPSFPPRQCGRTALHAGEGRSVHGVPLWTADVKPPQGDPVLRVLVLGGIHGDEPASVTLVLDWLERAGRAEDNKVHWRMVPLMNPDGLMARPSTRVNARGVDLNRNFPTPDWEALSTRYWVHRTRRDPRRYPGPKPMSEPETAWLYAQIGAFQPDLIVSVHAPYGVLDFDGPPPAPSRLGSLLLDRVGIYPGSLGNYGGVVRGVPVVTLELKRADAVPAAEVRALWEDLLGWMDRRLINVAEEASRQDGGRAP